MKKQKYILTGEIVACVLLIAFIYLTMDFTYGKTMNIGFIVSLPVSLIMVSLINWKDEVKRKGRVRVFTIFIILLTLILIFLLKPDYTYKEGLEIANNLGYSNIKETEEKSIFPSRLKTNKLVGKAYFYEGEKAGKSYYILVSPINGSTQIEEIDVRNYIDLYRENKEKNKN